MSEPTDRDLHELVDETRAAAAVRERGRGRWLRTQAAESARLTAVLLDAAERADTLTVRTAAGRRHVGRVLAVGRDFCGIATGGGEVYVALRAVTVIRPDPSMTATEPGDDRGGPLDLTLAELLAQEAPERPEVVLTCAGDPEPVTGVLRSVGVDVATVDGRPGLVYVALTSLVEVSFLASG